MRVTITLSKREIDLAEKLGLSVSDYIEKAMSEFYIRYSQPLNTKVVIDENKEV